MSFTNFPQGATSFGVPNVFVGQLSIPQIPGQVFFVDESGLFARTGMPIFRTIQNAIDRVQSERGATIIVFPGSYEENLTVSSKSYLTIVGAQIPGYARPDIVPTTGVALAATQSQGLCLRHLRFSSEDSDVVTNDGNGFIFEDCVFDGTAGMAATEACLRLKPNDSDDSYSASEGVVRNCLFRGATSGAGIIIQHAALPNGAGTSDNQIIGNRFYGNGVDLLTAVSASGGGAGIFINYLIAHNYFMTVGAAYVYADMDQGAAGDLTANSGLITGNYFADEALIAAQFDIATMANVIFTGNYDAAGLVNGAAFN